MSLFKALNRLFCDHVYRKIEARTQDYNELLMEGRHCTECKTTYWKDPYSGKFKQSK